MVVYINSWKNVLMYRWFHKPSLMYLEKRCGFYGPPIQISLKSSLTVLHAVSSAWQKTTPHIYYEKYSEANLL